MVASKVAGLSPRDLGQMIANQLRDDPTFVAVEVAGPGFINLKLSQDALSKVLEGVLNAGENYGKSVSANPQRINVEYVSVNPNGPITIGSGRGAAYGSTLCNVLEAAGNVVHREYYINDGVNSEQMRLFAESVKCLLRGESVPENGYRGDYVMHVADELKALHGATANDQPVSWFQEQSQALMLKKQCEDLEVFGVEFDTWFSEQSLHDQGIVADEVERLAKLGVADEGSYQTTIELGKKGEIMGASREEQAVNPNAAVNTLWLRSTKFGDDKDRVLRRQDGRLTYIASDVAYHRNKFSRPANADHLITVLGPDHHGYIGRLAAVVAATLIDQISAPTDPPELTESETVIFRDAAEAAQCREALALAKSKLKVQIFQLVRFVKDGKPAPMRKRDGNIYAIIDLVNEIGSHVAPDADLVEQQRIGRDVARFFYLSRSHDTTFDFDINLAETQSDENPVFYVQYAHARICSVISKAGEQNLTPSTEHLDQLVNAKERNLLLKLSDLPWEVRRCAQDFEIHRLTTFAVELARTYHHFYDECRVVQPEQPELSGARLALCEATRLALASCLSILGISAPIRM